MKFLIALLVGAASAFAFQPVGLWPLMPLAFAILCEMIARAPTLRRALLIGWGFAIGQFCVGLNWIATAFTFQAAMPAWLGWVAVVLLSLYLAAYPMLATGLAWRFGRDRPLGLVLALAGGWAIAEWLRATMFTGFAWNPVGVTLVDTWALPAASWAGTYGLSSLLVLGAGIVWLFFRHLIHEIRSKPLTWKRGSAILAFFVLPELLAVTLLPAFISSAPPSPLGQGTPIRIVQPNIGQQDKWKAGFGDQAAATLNRLSGVRDDRPQLLFWPEAAVTDPLADNRAGARPYIEYERQRATRTLGPGDVLLTGALAFASSDGRRIDNAANSVFALGPGGVVLGRYDKAHLVPYGEYLPMRPILSAIGLSRLAPGDLDFAPGPGPRTVTLPDAWGKVGFQLCYEIIFSGEVVDRADRPDFIFNPSNDAWFGRWGPPQHLAQARLRAAEEGLPVIRSTPTGISAIVDPSGRIVQSLPWQTAGVIDAALPAPLAPTLFARLGNVIPIALGFLLLIAAIALDRRRRYRQT